MRRTFLSSILLLSALGATADTDVTNTYVENPGFEARFAGWINDGFYYVTNQSFSRKQGYVYMERWVSSGGKIPNVEICQDLYLPVGTYRLTAACQNVQQSGNVEECTGAELYANSEAVTVTAANDYEVTFTVLQGKTQIGYRVKSTNANWATIDNVRLTLLDTDIEAEYAELQKLTDAAEAVIGEGEGAEELAASIAQAKELIASGGDENIGSIAKRLSDATLNYRILSAEGSAAKVTTNPYVASGATVLLGRMTTGTVAGGVLEKGFCWSESPEPTIFDNRSTRHFTNNGEIYRMERLKPGTMYYVRPYVLSNKYILSYGTVVKVPTLPQGNVTADYDNGGSTQENYRIASAIEEILWLYNHISSVKGINLSVHYGAQTPTADCSYGGWMRVGPNEAYQQTGTILHETNHGVGVGTSDIWWNGNYREGGDRGKWLGPRTTQMIQFLNKDDGAYMTGDNTHMWPTSSFSGPNFGINGSWEDTYNPENTLLYYGNVLLTHSLHQDGLICSSSVGFASPAYTFAQDDDTKYYIKTTDDACGNETSLLCSPTSGTVAGKSVSAAAAQADDSYAWNILYDPQTACYLFRNVGTGFLLSCSGQKYKTSNRTSPTAAERVQLLPSRSNYKKGPLNTSSYWITIGKTALKASSRTAVTGTTFDHSDANAQQHWLLLTADELTSFDNYCTQKMMPVLDSLLADARRSMQVPCKPISEEISVEAAAIRVTELLTRVEAEKESYSAGDLESVIAEVRQTFIEYLSAVKPVSADAPIPISWLIENRSFDSDASGWTGGPASVSYGVPEFLETTFNTSQTISPALPAGNYALTLNAFQRPGTYQNVYNDWIAGTSVVKAQMYSTGGGKSFSQAVQNIWSDASEARKTGRVVRYNNLYIPNNSQAAASWFKEGAYENFMPISMQSAGTLKIGLRCTKSEDSWWTCYDNFGLLFYGPYEATPVGIQSPYDPQSLPLGEAWYTLDGRRVAPSQLRHGIYIKAGRKVLF